MADRNNLIKKFDNYSKNSRVPFNNNNLINNNVHVKNNLNNLVKQKKMEKQSGIQSGSQSGSQSGVQNSVKNSSNLKKTDIFDDTFKTQKIVKENQDVMPSFKQLLSEIADTKNGKYKYTQTNKPYKPIIKDHIITKNINEISKEDFIVYKVNKKVDANINNFNIDLNKKNTEKKDIDRELEIEYDQENFLNHKETFSHKETFIKNLAYEENSYQDNKTDCIDFYKKKQRELEDGKKMCDEILKNIINDEFIDESELL